MNLKAILPHPDYLAHGFVGLVVWLVLVPLTGVLIATAAAWIVGLVGERMDAEAIEDALMDGLPPPATEDEMDIIWTGMPATVASLWATFWWDVPFLAKWML